MSIINDALKKVEKEQEQSFDVANALQGSKQEVVRIISEEKKNAVNFFATKMIVACVCGIFLLFVFIMIIMPVHKRPSVKFSSVAQESAPVAAGTVPEAQTVVEAKTSTLGKLIDPIAGRSRFKLSGIMLSEGGPTAIINNKIVREGDQVSGATVVSIEEKQARLSYQGQELTILIQ